MASHYSLNSISFILVFLGQQFQVSFTNTPNLKNSRSEDCESWKGRKGEVGFSLSKTTTILSIYFLFFSSIYCKRGIVWSFFSLWNFNWYFDFSIKGANNLHKCTICLPDVTICLCEGTIICYKMFNIPTWDINPKP